MKLPLDLPRALAVGATMLAFCLAATRAAGAVPEASPAGADSAGSPASATSVEQADRRPKLISRVDPDYPFEMRRKGIQGNVVVRFLVDTQGNVQSTQVVKSVHPTLDEEAAAAVRRWKFRPALKGGRPVEVYLQIPVGFFLDPLKPGEKANPAAPAGRSVNALKGSGIAPPPGVLRLDTVDQPPSIKSTWHPGYPSSLKNQPVAGDVTLAFVIDEKGGVRDPRVVRSSLPEFEPSALATIVEWRFKPARKKGRDVACLVELVMHFEPGP